MGAVLSCGPVTVASHLTGAHLHEMLPRRTGAIEVTTDRCPKRRSGIIIHRAALEPVEIVIIQGIPCTSVARTLIDLCATQPEMLCEIALDAALRMRRKSLEHLRAYVETAQSRSLPGRAVLRALLEQRGDDEALSESEAESIFARAMRKGKLPIGQRQAERPGLRNGRVDFFYPEQNLVIEIDGRKFHSGRREVKRDKRYDNELNIGSKRVLRLTYDDLVHDEAYTLDVVARALGIQRLW